MGLYASLSDDFYVNLNLNTEMELPGSRETILHRDPAWVLSLGGAETRFYNKIMKLSRIPKLAR